MEYQWLRMIDLCRTVDPLNVFSLTLRPSIYFSTRLKCVVTTERRIWMNVRFVVTILNLSYTENQMVISLTQQIYASLRGEKMKKTNKLSVQPIWRCVEIAAFPSFCCWFNSTPWNQLKFDRKKAKTDSIVISKRDHVMHFHSFVVEIVNRSTLQGNCNTHMKKSTKLKMWSQIYSQWNESHVKITVPICR